VLQAPGLQDPIWPRRTYFVQVSEDEIDDWLSALTRAAPKPPARPPDSPGPSKASLDDFERIRVIGLSALGKVQLVRRREDGRLYAPRSLRKSALREAGELGQAVLENGLRCAAHPFLVAAHDGFQTPRKVFLVLDYVPGGGLDARLREDARFAEPRARVYAAEILLGLGHLHKQGIVYRDLRPGNVLIDEGGHLRLTDCAVAKAGT
jgi:serine/threonine protein kinase